MLWWRKVYLLLCHVWCWNSTIFGLKRTKRIRGRGLGLRERVCVCEWVSEWLGSLNFEWAASKSLISCVWNLSLLSCSNFEICAWAGLNDVVDGGNFGGYFFLQNNTIFLTILLVSNISKLFSKLTSIV